MRLRILPTGYIYPKEQSAVRDLLRERRRLVRQRTTHVLTTQSTIWRHTAIRVPSKVILGEKEAPRPELPDRNVKLGIQAHRATIKLPTKQIETIECTLHRQVKTTPSLSCRFDDALSRRTLTVLGLFLMRDEPSILFVSDGAGYRVVSGAPSEPGVQLTEVRSVRAPSGQALSQFKEFVSAISRSAVPAARYYLLHLRLNEALEAGDVSRVPTTTASVLAELDPLRRRADGKAEEHQEAAAPVRPADHRFLDALPVQRPPCTARSRACRGRCARGLVRPYRTFAGPPRVMQWLSDLRTINSETTSHRVRVMLNGMSLWSQRLAVAAAFLADEASGPAVLLQAHATLLMFNVRYFSEELRGQVCAAIVGAWQRRSHGPAPRGRHRRSEHSSGVSLGGNPAAKSARIALVAPVIGA